MTSSPRFPGLPKRDRIAPYAFITSWSHGVVAVPSEWVIVTIACPWCGQTHTHSASIADPQQPGYRYPDCPSLRDQFDLLVLKANKENERQWYKNLVAWRKNPVGEAPKHPDRLVNDWDNPGYYVVFDHDSWIRFHAEQTA